MEIILQIQKLTNGVWDAIFVFFTLFGEELIFLAVAATVYWCVSKQDACKLLLLYLVSAIVNTVVKLLVREPRPTGVRKLFGDSATGYAFPSGHTQSVSLYSSALVRKYARKKPLAYVLGGVLIALVAVSRMYLGHHFLQDVVAGAVLGCLIGWFGMALLNRVNISSKWLLVLLIPLAVLLFTVNSRTVGRAVGGAGFFFIGYVLEERFVKSGDPSSFAAAIMRALIGLGVAAGLYFALNLLPGDNRFRSFLIFSVLGFWVSFLAPLLFKQLERVLFQRKTGSKT